MMLLRSTLAFLVVLPAALAKDYRGRKTVKSAKSSKAIQEVYFLKDDVTTLGLEIDFIAILRLLQNLPHLEAVVSEEEGSIGIFGGNSHPSMDTMDGIMSSLMIDNMRGTRLLSDGEVTRITGKKMYNDIGSKYPDLQFLDTMGVPETLERQELLENILKKAILMDGDKEQQESESSNGYFADACTVIDGVNSPLMLNISGTHNSTLWNNSDWNATNYYLEIKKQVCNIDVCVGTNDESGDPSCFNLRFSGKRNVDISSKGSGRRNGSMSDGWHGDNNGGNNGGDPRRKHGNSFTASLNGGTGRFAMAQGQARFIVAQPKRDGNVPSRGLSGNQIHAQGKKRRDLIVVFIEYTIPEASSSIFQLESEEALHAH